VITDDPVPEKEFAGHSPVQVSMLVAAVDVENLPAGQLLQSEYAVNFIVLDATSGKSGIISLHVLPISVGDVLENAPVTTLYPAVSLTAHWKLSHLNW
jgi:hypothetical protein